MARPKKPKQYVGKITLVFDCLRVPDEDGDARELFPVRDAMMDAAIATLKAHGQAWIGHVECRVRPRPKGIVYENERASASIPEGARDE